MESIDWNEAPDGATHYNAACGCPWLKETPASYFHNGDWIEYTPKQPNKIVKHFNNAVKRPQEWDGKGMPPIGTVCEYFWQEGREWRKCEVVAYYHSNVVAVDKSDYDAVLMHPTTFRPFKTHEQIAAEQRLHAIDEMVDLGIGYSSVFRDAMCKIYDAGYRKTEVKK